MYCSWYSQAKAYAHSKACPHAAVVLVYDPPSHAHGKFRLLYPQSGVRLLTDQMLHESGLTKFDL